MQARAARGLSRTLSKAAAAQVVYGATELVSMYGVFVSSFLCFHSTGMETFLLSPGGSGGGVARGLGVMEWRQRCFSVLSLGD